MREEQELCNANWIYGMYSEDNLRTWTLSLYMEQIAGNNVTNEWDGLERSIIANFADDVSIGVRSGKLEITITKTF